MNNFSSYGEDSGFSAIPAEKLELVNGGKDGTVTIEVPKIPPAPRTCK